MCRTPGGRGPRPLGQHFWANVGFSCSSAPGRHSGTGPFARRAAPRDGAELAVYAEPTGRPGGPFPAEARFFDLAGGFQRGGGEGTASGR